ncbi:MAG: dihydropyrimidinase [Candidatus Eisenbacteria bacterium]
MSTFIKGGRLVTEVDSYDGSVLVEDGRIAAAGRGLEAPDGADVVDASGLLVMPGVVDVHVHVALPLRDRCSSDFEATSREAAFGGVTTFIAYAMPARGQTLMEVVEARKEQAHGNCYVDYGFHAALINWAEREDDEIPELIEAGVPSFKVFTVYSREGWRSGDEELYRAFLLTARHGGLVEVHCESEWMIDRKVKRLVEEGRLSAADHAASRPGYVEGDAVSNVLRIAYDAGAPVHIVHVSSGEGAEAIAEGCELGMEIYAETCPHFLLLDDGKLAGADGHRYATCPPLRPKTHHEALWEALDDGTIQVIATDHAEFTAADKDAGAADFREIPMGIPGVGTLLPLMWHHGVGEGHMTENELVDRLCTQPSEIFGLQPAKGSLAVGSDADIVLFDPTLDVTIGHRVLHGHADYSPYAGLEVRGWPVSTMVRGSWVVRDRELVGSHELGSFVHRGPVCQRPGRRAG